MHMKFRKNTVPQERKKGDQQFLAHISRTLERCLAQSKDAHGYVGAE
jgi:hypothetical protein